MPDDIDLNFILGGEASGLVPRVAALEVGLEAIAETKELNMVAGCISEVHMPMWLQMRASWYSEPLGTVTRGTRRDMPTRLVVIAESNTITLFDGDDPDFPMWMVFERGSGKFVIGPPTTIAMSGNVLVAGNDQGSALFEIDFAADGARWVYSPGIRYFDEPISGRNATGWTQGPSSGGIAGNFVHSVALPLLPGAPTNPASGLPMPTIVAGTDGGVSVIAPDGEVKNSSFASQVKDLAIIDEHIWFTYGGSTSFPVRVSAGKISELSAGWSDTFYKYAAGAPAPPLVHSSINALASGWRGAVIYSGVKGAGVLMPDHNAQAQGMVSLMTSTYATGWMHGDTRLATLCETEAGALGGGELVTNGDFSAMPPGASASSGTALYYLDGGELVTEGTANFDGVVISVTGLTPGAWYQASVDLLSGTARATLSNVVGSLTPDHGWYNVDRTGPMTITGAFQAASNGILVVALRTVTAGQQCRWDNLSVVEAMPDRSVHANPLKVVGTGLTCAPVATGTELCAVSGFSGTSYLEQPYNTGLDFGTGDFCVAGWCKHSGVSTQFFMHRAGGGGAELSVLTLAGKIRAAVGTVNLSTANDFPVNEWFGLMVVRSSGVLTIFINGEIAASAPCTDDITNISAPLLLGSGPYPLSGGSMALWRISATAPTAEQIAVIYADEKPLFQENAACTLEGTSDAVNALAHDPETGLLHIGTPDARSTFSGLTRVDETASGASVIAARGGMVLEG